MKSIHITFNIFRVLDVHNFRTNLVWGVNVKGKGIKSHFQWCAMFLAGGGKGERFIEVLTEPMKVLQCVPLFCHWRGYQDHPPLHHTLRY